mmetsp:Transcript_9299/g.18085  ORF Transcript_9299/g.18085 Transcript_9299/m.18085 type:complete len:472 (-) Transcript_9299:131-1546(-)
MVKKKCLFRHESCLQVDALEKVKKGYGLVIDGAKGSGKSTLTWAWATEKAAKGETVLWAHIDNRTTKCTVVRLQKDVVKRVLFNNRVIDYSELRDSQFLDSAEDDIVVLDGFHHSVHESIVNQLMDPNVNKKGRRKILVSSFQAYFKVQDLMIVRSEAHRVASWTEEEYETAIQDTEFYEQVKNSLGPGKHKKEQLFSKLYYSGYSARFTFQFSIDQTKTEISTGIEKLGSYEKALSQDHSQAIPTAVNTLYAGIRCGDGAIKDAVVSKYTLRKMVEAKPSKALALAYRLGEALDNNSFLGWVYEADFLMNAKAMEQILLFDEKGEGAFKCDIKTVQYFSDITEINWKHDNCLWIPTKHNNPAFDFLYVHRKSHMRIALFGNVTISPRHSCKLQHIKAAMELSDLERLRYCAIAPLKEDKKKVGWDPPPADHAECLKKFKKGVSAEEFSGRDQCETLFFKSRNVAGAKGAR